MSDKPSSPGSSSRTVQLQIEIDPEIAKGAFVNMALVNHTDAEFTLDLIYVPPQSQKGSVRARVITTPKHMKRLVHAITENLDRFEARFGAIDVGSEPGFPQTGIANA